MRHDALNGRSLTAMVLVALVVACDKGPNTPTGPSTTIQPPVVSIEVAGPSTLAPGQSAQYSVIVRSSDGVTRVPESIHWRASPTALLHMDAAGFATSGPVNGDASVSVDVTIAGPGGGLKHLSRNVFVMPEGTYRVTGFVSDVDRRGLTGALIEVTPGSLVTSTDGGRFLLHAVPADAEFRITAYGHEPLVQALSLTSNATRNFQLTPSGSVPSLAGLYTLALEAPGACQGGAPLPADLQHRRYDAVVSQDGVWLKVVLTEPRFAVDGPDNTGNWFRGRTGPSSATFDLDDIYPYDFYDLVYPSLAERLLNGTVLIFNGKAATTASPAGLSGTLTGSAAIWTSGSPRGNPIQLGHCSGQYRFTLTPR